MEELEVGDGMQIVNAEIKAKNDICRKIANYIEEMVERTLDPESDDDFKWIWNVKRSELKSQYEELKKQIAKEKK
jgi:hypothetical protein